MATYMTYSTLVSDITGYLERGGTPTNDQQVFNQIPRFINAAERKLMEALKLQGVITPLVDPAGLQFGQAIVTKPDRWRVTVSMNYGSGTNKQSHTPLFPRSYEYCRAYWPDDTVTDPNNPPAYYADYDQQHWLIVPTPDQTYPLEAILYMQPPLLDSVNQSNFWTIYCGNALLYASLLEAQPYLKGDDRIPTWEKFLNTEVTLLGGQDLQKIFDRAAQRSAA